MDTLFRLVSFQQPHSKQQQQQQQNSSDNHSFNNSTTSNRSNSSNSSIRSSSKQTLNNNYNNNNSNYSNNYNYHPYYNNNNSSQQEEECFNFFMDEEDFSSSSSHNNKHYQQQQQQQQQQYSSNYPYYQQQQYPCTSQSVLDPSSTTTSTPTHGGSVGSGGGDGDGYGYGGEGSCLFNYSDPSAFSGKWASSALLDAARAVSSNDTARLHQLLWVLNELSSPYGDVEQKLASYFTQALFTRMTDSGDRCHRNMRVAVDKTFSFESTRKMLLKFQEVSPWSTFGHVASNGALIDALEGEAKLHIVDISNTFCTQWPTLLEALATRMDDTPHLKLTTILVNKLGGGNGGGDDGGGGVQRVMREIGSRLEKFARLMGVPFKFSVIHHVGDLSTMNLSSTLDLSDDEALAINCVNTLHGVTVQQRDAVLSAFRRLSPRVVTVVEEEADIADVGSGSDDGGGGYGFMRGFSECLRWFRVYFESLDETFARTSNEKLMLERAAGRALVDLLACPEAASSERRETAGRWSERMGRAGLGNVGFSDEVCDDVRALLRRYKEGWSMTQCGGGESGGGGAGIFLCWKDQPVVWAGAWKA